MSVLIIDTVLFDIDETLMPSRRIEKESLGAAYTLINGRFEFFSLDDFVKRMREIRKNKQFSPYYYTPEHFLFFLEENGCTEHVGILATQMFVAYTDKRISITKKHPGVAELLEYLKEHRYISLIVSRGDTWNQYEKLVRTNMPTDYFLNFYISEDEDKSPNLLKAIEESGGDPKTTVYIGDDPAIDLPSALKAGVMIFLINREFFTESSAQVFRFDDIPEVLAFFKKNIKKSEEPEPY